LNISYDHLNVKKHKKTVPNRFINKFLIK